jgi:hypothetical protein
MIEILSRGLDIVVIGDNAVIPIYNMGDQNLIVDASPTLDLDFLPGSIAFAWSCLDDC